MWGCGWGPYSSVTSSGSTSPRKWALKSSCRHDASTDSCSESKSSWVVRQGGGEAVGPQPRCPSTRSLWTSAPTSDQPAPPPPEGPHRAGGQGSRRPGLLPPEAVGSPHLQDLVHNLLHDLALGLCVTETQKREEPSGPQVAAEAGQSRAGVHEHGPGGWRGARRAVCCSLGSAPRRRDVPTMLLRLAEAPPLRTHRVRTGVLGSEAAPPPAQAP